MPSHETAPPGDGERAEGRDRGVRVECTDCPFDRTVREGGGERPVDVLFEHGRETGHVLRIHRHGE